MPREDYRMKAVRYLGEGRLTVRHVGNPRIEATCRGDSGELYPVGYAPGGWACDCPAKGRCAHLQALMRHPAARRRGVSAEQRTLEDYQDQIISTVRDVGSRRADFDPDWREAAADAIRTLAASGEVFDAEDVRHLAGDPPSPNAIGAAFLVASQAGLIQSVGIRKAARIQRHGSWVRTWRGRSAP